MSNEMNCIICEKRNIAFDYLYFCKQCYKKMKGKHNEKTKNKKQNTTSNR